jgi:hypothetical protein
MSLNTDTTSIHNIINEQIYCISGIVYVLSPYWTTILEYDPIIVKIAFFNVLLKVICTPKIFQ